MRAYFVGSIAADDAEQVINEIADRVGEVTPHIPDGETGNRSDWAGWQINVMANAAQLEGVGEQTVSGDYVTFTRFRLRAGVSADDLELGPLGYASAAVSSYQTFRRLQDEGRIGSSVRFLASIATPVAITTGFIDEGHDAFERGYERHLRRETEAMLEEIPASALAIQWDVAIEMAMLEGVFPSYIQGELLPELTVRLGRLGEAVPEDVALGYHLCYGNRNNEHFLEPKDSALLVKVANGLTASCPRQIDWIHMPVPIEREDDEYFAPLRELELQDSTELCLGLLHKEDGLDGASRRYNAAHKAVGAFSVACECGMGREPADAIPNLLDLHAQACHELPRA